MATRLEKHAPPYRITYRGETIEFTDYDHTVVVDDDLAQELADHHQTITIKTRSPRVTTPSTEDTSDDGDETPTDDEDQDED